MARMKPRPVGSPHEALVAMMEQIPGGAQAAADFEDRSIFTLYKELDPDQQGEISFARVARLMSRFKATAPAEYLAALVDGVFVPLPQGDGLDELSAEIGKSAQAFGQMVKDFGQSILDGALDRRETTALRADIRKVQTALARLDETLKARAGS